MSTLEFVTSIVGTLAWPLTLVVAIIVLQRPLAQLIPRMKSTELLGFKAEFAQELREIAKAAGATANVPRLAASTEENENRPVSAEYGLHVREIVYGSWKQAKADLVDAQRIAVEQPYAAVTQAYKALWFQIEILCHIERAKIERRGEKVSYRSGGQLKFLAESNFINEEHLNNLAKLGDIAIDSATGKQTLDDGVASIYVIAATEYLGLIIAQSTIARATDIAERADSISSGSDGAE